MHSFRPLSLAFLFCLLGSAFGFILPNTFLRAAVTTPTFTECIGKTYPSPGCPLKGIGTDIINSLGRPVHCGDAIVQSNEGEECDLGRFNGISTCSDACTLLYCGDTVVTPFLGEECEPTFNEVYAIDPKTGQIGTQRTFTIPTCGKSCSPPLCDVTGNCSGGCEWIFLATCAGSGSSTSQNSPLEVVSIAQSSLFSSQASELMHTVAPTVRCGDGVLQDSEECDDGMRNSDLLPNACRTNCRKSYCGDATTDHGEQCDTGARNGQLCISSYGQSCTYCASDCRMLAIQGPRCGDGTVDESEQCDDAARNGQICTPTYGQSCTYCISDCRTKTVQGPRCGDGTVDQSEQCDDGARNGQVCTASYGQNCSYCANDCRELTFQGPRCGDGAVDKSEQCDDGARNGQICSASYNQTCDYCTNECALTTIHGPHCGDATINLGEQCDDGPRNSDVIQNSCRTNCTLPHCGDEIIDKGEQCDNGVRNGQRCTVSDGQSCDFCSLECSTVTLSGPRCGDGILQSSEQCDDGPRNSDVMSNACRTTCTLPRCGDDILDKSESCDQGAANSDVAPNTCRLDCSLPHCGDFVIDRGEECDGGKDCTSQCRTIGFFAAHAGTIASGGIAAIFLSLILSFLFRRNILSTLGSEMNGHTIVPSIDDVPLDTIEMPWQKFGGKPGK
ncbi:MAG: hypothetical protein WCG83_00130 [Candidatus Peregrinibacteria bacterium]